MTRTYPDGRSLYTVNGVEQAALEEGGRHGRSARIEYNQAGQSGASPIPSPGHRALRHEEQVFHGSGHPRSDEHSVDRQAKYWQSYTTPNRSSQHSSPYPTTAHGGLPGDGYYHTVPNTSQNPLNQDSNPQHRSGRQRRSTSSWPYSG
jgi:hypothetical protein